LSDEDHERRTIRDAMDRLLAGAPIRSDGKLTVKSLAAEAGVKRWLLTHKHQDLQGEFRDKVQAHGSTPDALKALLQKNQELERRIERALADLKQADAELKRFARIVQVLTLENEQLRSSAGSSPSNVTPLTGRRPRAKEQRP